MIQFFASYIFYILPAEAGRKLESRADIYTCELELLNIVVLRPERLDSCSAVEELWESL